MSKTIFALRADCDEVLLCAFSSRKAAESAVREIVKDGHEEDYVSIAEIRLDPDYLAFFDLKLKGETND